MTAVQMNIRIDRDLKAAGDEAFGELGYSPTEVVREVWGFAKRNRHNRTAINDMLHVLKDPDELAAEEEALAQRMAELNSWLARGENIMRDFNERAGRNGAIAALSAGEYDNLLGQELDEEGSRLEEGR